jgi:hypothetical protein
MAQHSPRTYIITANLTDGISCNFDEVQVILMLSKKDEHLENK